MEPRTMFAADVVLPAATSNGEWPQYRGDPGLSGRSPLVGNINEPEILWEYDVGLIERYYELKLGGATGIDIENALPSFDNLADFDELWQRGGPLYDLDRTGELTAIEPSIRHRIGDFLPQNEGLERLRFDTTSDTGDELIGVAYLMRREAGEWVEVWQTDSIDNLYQPKPIVGDFDNDGQLEFAVVPHQYLHVYDMATGELEQRVEFQTLGNSSPRSNGWFGARDLNGDGRDEFVMLGDFENFVSVIGWNGSNELVKLWDYTIEAGIANKQTIHWPAHDALADMNGDGVVDIVTSIYNDRNSGKWEAIVYDGLTGESLTRIPDRIAKGVVDLDGNGNAELFLADAYHLSPSVTNSVEIMTWRNETLTRIWTAPDASFVETLPAESPLNVHTAATAGRSQIALLQGEANDRSIFAISKFNPANGHNHIYFWQFNDDQTLTVVGRFHGEDIEVVGSRDNALLVRELATTESGNDIHSMGVTSEFQWMARAPAPLTTPIIGYHSTEHARPTVVVQGSGEQVHAIRLDENGNPIPIWQTDGRGVYTGSPLHTGIDGYAGLVMAELHGNGAMQTVIATAGEQGKAVLQALGDDGLPIWSLAFDGLSGETPEWNHGGLTTWQAGRFRDVGHDDLLVSIRRSTMHSDELSLVDGSTGEIIWTRTTAYDSRHYSLRGAGGSWMALTDYDGDGLHEAINFYPDVFTVIDGDGTVLLERSFHHDLIPGRQALYGTPVVADFLGDGSLTVYYGGSAFETGLFHLDGTPIWTGPWRDGSPGILPAIGDFNDDASLEIVSVGHRKTDGNSIARAVDAATGQLLWSLDLPGTPFNNNGWPIGESPLAPVVADIDGDGSEEAIFSIGDTLYSLGFNSAADAPEIEWSMEFDATLGAPALADLRGGAPLQIIVTSVDGRVYGVGEEVVYIQNQDNRYDVNADGEVTLNDALQLVSHMRHTQLRRGLAPMSTLYVDVNGDEQLTLGDALELISHLRNVSSSDSDVSNDAVLQKVAAALDRLFGDSKPVH